MQSKGVYVYKFSVVFDTIVDQQKYRHYYSSFI